MYSYKNLFLDFSEISFSAELLQLAHTPLSARKSQKQVPVQFIPNPLSLEYPETCHEP
jgi:hypothetical protein